MIDVDYFIEISCDHLCDFIQLVKVVTSVGFHVARKSKRCQVTHGYLCLGGERGDGVSRIMTLLSCNHVEIL